jgi:hypothetical protein
MIDQLEILSLSEVQFITIVFGGSQLCYALYLGKHGKLHEFGGEKPISCVKLAHFDFFAINFTFGSHILSTVGDALTPSKLSNYFHLC